MSPPQSMTALSGVPYGPNSGSIRPDVNMTDISSYQPWKALNEFAMHNDMDQGAFQQLVRWPIFSLTMVIALPCLGLKWCCALILGYSFHLVLSDHYLSSYPSLTFLVQWQDRFLLKNGSFGTFLYTMFTSRIILSRMRYLKLNRIYNISQRRLSNSALITLTYYHRL